MKIRHVRAIAVFGIALVALTGARGSGGGGCSSSSSSSSSSGSHSDSDSDDDYDGTSGSGGGFSSGGGSNEYDAARDLTIGACEYDEADGFTAEVTASNTGDEIYDYTFTVEFNDAFGATLASESGAISHVMAGSTKSLDVLVPDTGAKGGDAGGECEVVGATRSTV